MSKLKRSIAKQAVEAIVYDLTDRSGLSDEWDAIDEDTQVEIRNKWHSIIAQALDNYSDGIRDE